MQNKFGNKRFKSFSLTGTVLVMALILTACGDATATLAPATTQSVTTAATTTTAAATTVAVTKAQTTSAATTQRKSKIIEPTTGFPRKIEAVNGIIEIKQKPQHIHTLSVGYDEITFRLVDPSRIAAVGQSTADPSLSNVADLAGQVPLKVGRSAEQVI